MVPQLTQLVSLVGVPRQWRKKGQCRTGGYEHSMGGRTACTASVLGAEIPSKKGHSQRGQDLPSLPVLLMHQALISWPPGMCTSRCEEPG